MDSSDVCKGTTVKKETAVTMPQWKTLVKSTLDKSSGKRKKTVLDNEELFRLHILSINK